MKKTIFTLFCFVAFSIFNTNFAKAQCQAVFNVYPDTSLGAPLHTYLGDNACIGANFLGIDTINYTYTWTWGDGTSTTAPFPSHTYATTGNYTICLYMNAVNPAGCNDTLCINANILKNAAMAYIKIKNPYVVASAKDVAEHSYTVFPNPATNKMFIHGLLNESYNFAIYGVDGRLISNPSLQNSQWIEVSALAKGNYVLKITSVNSNKSSVLKFFKD